MRLTIRALFFLILSIAIPGITSAQKATYTTNGGMTIGFGVGTAYQQSDVANSRGGGFDFTLGSNIWKKENAFLSIDWKFRFLAGENMAHDHRINLDGTYSNARLGFFNYDFELGLTLNRLRERTRIVITGFAGPGITHGFTATDLEDESGNPYDYTGIDPTQSRKEIYADLIELTDGKFETKLDNRAALLPTAGIYIGYQFSRSFSLGIEHKINFSLTEKNSFTGINIDGKIASVSGTDMNHYTTLGFKWMLGGGSAGQVRRPSYIPTEIITDKQVEIKTEKTIVVTPPPPPPPPTSPAPVVEIIIPASESSATTSSTAEITARVLNVRGRQDIRVTLNNSAANFEYNQVYRNVKLTAGLSEGRNTIIITAANESGSVRDEVVITRQKPVQAALPTVRFTEPSVPVTVEKGTYSIAAQTRNVKAWQDVTVTVNGVDQTNFNFTQEGAVTTNVGLREGQNNVEIKVKNESGSASDRALITYKKPQPAITPVTTIEKPVPAVPPVITILSPASSPYNTYDQSLDMRARITGIKSKEGISVTINGINTTAFTFELSTQLLNLPVSLREGNNTVTVSARNEAGQDSETQVMVKETRPCPPPVLNLIEPAKNEILTDKSSIKIRTEARNIQGREQLTLRFNGGQLTNFSLSGSEVNADLLLKEGTNSYVVTAKTNCGTAILEYSIYYKPAEVQVVVEKPCPKPSLGITVEPVSRPDATHILKGISAEVKTRSDIIVTINNQPFESFTFNAATGEIGATFRFTPGVYTIRVDVKNNCGSDSKTASVSVDQPCVPPRVIITLTEVNRPDATHELKGQVTNIKNKSDISVTVNGSPVEDFSFVPNTGELSSKLKFDPGTYTVKVDARNDCGSDSKTASATVVQPCDLPGVTFTVAAVQRDDATHELKGTVTNVKERSGISMTVNGQGFDRFTFTPSSGALNAAFSFEPGTYNIKADVTNECGQKSYSRTVNVEEKPCGIRINPGNSSWEFCLVTSSGTMTRDTLKGNFSYSGSATSLYFKPIAGGGDAEVRGKPYRLTPGQYYLFTGNLTVKVSNRNPGSMGHWSVCIVADREPVFGNGDERPASPCQVTGDDKKLKKEGDKQEKSFNP